MIEGLLICYFIFNILMILGYLFRVASIKGAHYRPSLLIHTVNIVMLATGGTLFLIVMIFYIIYLDCTRN